MSLNWVLTLENRRIRSFCEVGYPNGDTCDRGHSEDAGMTSLLRNRLLGLFSSLAPSFLSFARFDLHDRLQ